MMNNNPCIATRIRGANMDHYYCFYSQPDQLLLLQCKIKKLFLEKTLDSPVLCILRRKIKVEGGPLERQFSYKYPITEVLNYNVNDNHTAPHGTLGLTQPAASPTTHTNSI